MCKVKWPTCLDNVVVGYCIVSLSPCDSKSTCLNLVFNLHIHHWNTSYMKGFGFVWSISLWCASQLIIIIIYLLLQVGFMWSISPWCSSTRCVCQLQMSHADSTSMYRQSCASTSISLVMELRLSYTLLAANPTRVVNRPLESWNFFNP